MIGYGLTCELTCDYGPGKVYPQTNGIGVVCGPGWIHYYSDPLLLFLLNPINAGPSNTTIWEYEIGGIISDNVGLLCGCTEATILRKIEHIQLTAEQRAKFGILCALEVYNEPKFVQWAKNWLVDNNRAFKTARDVSLDVMSNLTNYSGYSVTHVFYHFANSEHAAGSAFYAARAAAYADPKANYLSYVDKDVAEAAYHAASVKKIDTVVLAHKAMTDFLEGTDDE